MFHRFGQLVRAQNLSQKETMKYLEGRHNVWLQIPNRKKLFLIFPVASITSKAFCGLDSLSDIRHSRA
jgi:hypothetical protein